jgi:hypothetical protein
MFTSKMWIGPIQPIGERRDIGHCDLLELMFAAKRLGFRYIGIESGAAVWVHTSDPGNVFILFTYA